MLIIGQDFLAAKIKMDKRIMSYHEKRQADIPGQ